MLEGLCARVAAAHVPTMSQIASTLDYSFLSRMSVVRQKLQALGTQDDQRSHKLTSQEPGEFSSGTAHRSSKHPQASFQLKKKKKKKK